MDIAICDRSFCDLDEVIETKFFGRPGVLIYKIASCCDRTNNDERFWDSAYNQHGDDGSDETKNRHQYCKERDLVPLV